MFLPTLPIIPIPFSLLKVITQIVPVVLTKCSDMIQPSSTSSCWPPLIHKNQLQPPTCTRPLIRSQSLVLPWHLRLPAQFSSYPFHESRLPGDFGLSISLLPAESVATSCFYCKEERVLLFHISTTVLPCTEAILQGELWAVGFYSHCSGVAELHSLPIPLCPDSRGICLSITAAESHKSTFFSVEA